MSDEAFAALVNGIRTRVEEARATIAVAAQRAGRRPDEVTIVAVTKAFPPEIVRAAVAAGLTHIGENRVQEARDKRLQLEDLRGVTWHLVGHLQKNKAAAALRLFDCIHSVDSLELAQILAHRAEALGRVIPILLEVNVGGEPTKFGFRLDDPSPLYRAVEGVLLLPALRLEGLMTVAPICSDPEEVRPVFRRLRELRDALRERYPDAPWSHLSMGMTDDYPVAVEEGATLVRLGRALFGERPA